MTEEDTLEINSVRPDETDTELTIENPNEVRLHAHPEKGKSDRLNVAADKNAYKYDINGVDRFSFLSNKYTSFWQRDPESEDPSPLEKIWRDFFKSIGKLNDPDKFFADSIATVFQFMENLVVGYADYQNAQEAKRLKKFKENRNEYVKFMTEHHQGIDGIRNKTAIYVSNAMFSDMIRDQDKANGTQNWEEFRNKYANLVLKDQETGREYIDITRLPAEDKQGFFDAAGGQEFFDTKQGFFDTIRGFFGAEDDPFNSTIEKYMSNFVAGDLFHFKLNVPAERKTVTRSWLNMAAQQIFRGMMEKNASLKKEVEDITKNMTKVKKAVLYPILEAEFAAEKDRKSRNIETNNAVYIAFERRLQKLMEHPGDEKAFRDAVSVLDTLATDMTKVNLKAKKWGMHAQEVMTVRRVWKEMHKQATNSQQKQALDKINTEISQRFRF